MKIFLLILIVSSLIGCVPKDSSISVDFYKKNSIASPGSIQSATVSSIQIINNQLVINGNGFGDVLNVKVDGASFNENFSIESQTATKIIANSIRAFSFDVSKVFNVIISDANASATFPIDFSLCNATLNGKGFDCAAPISDKDVLSYDAVSGTWKPRAVSGLNYLGAFDASSNPATGPATQPAGAYYIISASGTIASIQFTIGDWLVSNGSAWQKIDNSTAVLSVFGRNGTVTAQTGDYTLDMLGDISFPTAPVAGKVLKFDGTHWVAGDDLSGGGAGSVTTTTIAAGAVTDAKIDTVSASKITGTISGTQMADGTISYAKLNIADGDIPATKISGLPSTADFVTKSTNSTVIGQITIDPTTGVLNVPTPASATQATPKAWVENLVDSYSHWVKSGANTSFTTGNVGIGAAASSYKLDVSGSMKTQSMSVVNATPYIEIKDTAFTNAQNGRMGFIAFIDSAGVQNSYIGDGLGTSNALTLTTTVNEAIKFVTNSVDRMIVSSFGYVGIGTTGPSAKLHIQDGGLLVKGTGATLTIKNGFGSENSLSTESVASFDNEGFNGSAVNFFTSTDKNASIYFGNTGAPQQGYLRYFVSGTPANQYMSMTVNSAERLRITSSGNVGIGTTTIDEKLVVDNGTTIGKYTTGGWTHSSDRRMKHSISPIEDALNKVLKLKGVEYIFNSDPSSKTQLGFIAQDVEPIFPEVVQTDEKGFKSMIYGNLVAPLVESVKALYARIQIQDRQIASKADKTFVDEKVRYLTSENEKLKKENLEIKAYICSKDAQAKLCK